MLQILDLYCGAGGSAKGMAQACEKHGVEYNITGIDIDPMPNYPYTFIQGDVYEIDFNRFKPDFIWASPPCQLFSVASAKHKDYPNLIPVTHTIFSRIRERNYGDPIGTAIENVMRAPIRKDLMLCGQMFRKKLYRHRRFEIEGFKVKQKNHYPHDTRQVRGRDVFTVAGHEPGTLKQWSQAMGIKWMTREELVEACPPFYSKYIFEAFLKERIL